MLRLKLLSGFSPYLGRPLRGRRESHSQGHDGSQNGGGKQVASHFRGRLTTKLLVAGKFKTGEKGEKRHLFEQRLASLNWTSVALILPSAQHQASHHP